MSGYLDDLLARIAQLKSQAAALCEPMLAPERAELVAALQALPDAQFEAAMALVLDHNRHDDKLMEAAMNVSYKLLNCVATLYE